MSEAVRDVVLLSFPHQLPHALAALDHHRRMQGRASGSPALFFVWSHQPAEHAAGSRFRHLFEALLRPLPWARLAFPGRIARSTLLSPHLSIRARIAVLERLLGPLPVERCYFAHDASADHTAQVLLQWRPQAEAVCFGDPPGFLHPAPPAAEARRQLAKRWIAPGPARSSRAPAQPWRTATLHLIAVRFQSDPPVAGDVRLLPREELAAMVQRLRDGVPEVARAEHAWLRSLPAAGGARHPLLVMSNFTESRLTSRTEELALYRDILLRERPEGGLVLVKPHAGTSAPFLLELRKRLPRHRLEPLPPELRWWPLELLARLLAASTVLSVSSASVLLALLNGRQHVRHVLTGEDVARYFLPGARERFARDNAALHAALAELGGGAPAPTEQTS